MEYELIKEYSVVGNGHYGDNSFYYADYIEMAKEKEKLPADSTLSDVVEKINTIVDERQDEKDTLLNILKSKNVEVSEEDKMLDLIEKVDLLKALPIVYGVQVLENVNDPSTSVTYIEQAIGVTPANSTGYGDWKNKFPFNQIKPCGFKNGKVYKYIQENNFTSYEDGEAVEEDVDVMIEFPKIYWKFTQIDNGYQIRISDTKLDDEYMCLAHSIGDREVDKIYIGAYLGYNSDGKLRSMKDKSPTVSQTIGTFRTQAQANGEGYQQFNHYSMLMLQILYLIMYKNLDSQSVLGKGYISAGSKTNTGATAQKGMIFGTSSLQQQMKFLGIEDLWGNVCQWVDGFYYNSSRKMLIGKNDMFNDYGNGYEDCGQGNTSDEFGYIAACQGTTKTGFIIKTSGGRNYCDFGNLYANSVGFYGGRWNEGTTGYVGIFRLYVGLSATTSQNFVGSRLIYLG